MKYCLIFSFCIFLLGCRTVERERDQPITLREPSQYASFKFQLTDSVLIFKLPPKSQMGFDLWPLADTAQTGTLSKETKVVRMADRWYAHDTRNPLFIFQFDELGNYINKFTLLDPSSASPKSSEIVDFLAFNDHIYTLTSNPTIISIFSSSGQLISQIAPAVDATSFGKRSNGNLLINNKSYLEIGQDRILELDSTGKEFRALAKNNFKGEKLDVHERNFFTYDSITLLAEAFQNTIYQVRAEGLIPAYHLDFGKHSVPPKFWDVPIYEGFESLNQQGFYTVLDVLENSKNRMLILNFQNAKGIIKWLMLIDKRSEKILTMRLPEDSIFSHPIMITEQNDFIFYTHSQEFSAVTSKDHVTQQPRAVEVADSNPKTPILFWARIKK